jgi:alkaline phosphatase
MMLCATYTYTGSDPNMAEGRKGVLARPTDCKISRRGFFGRTRALASVAGSLNVLEAARRPGAQLRNVIFMVADGMSPGVLPLAEHFSQLVRGNGLLWRALIDRPEAARALVDMASLNSVTTDSSAASSSWASGTRIFNGWANMLPDGTKLTTIDANPALAMQHGLVRALWDSDRAARQATLVVRVQCQRVHIYG